MTKYINADRTDTRRVRYPMPAQPKLDKARGSGTPTAPRGPDTFPQMRRGARSK